MSHREQMDRIVKGEIGPNNLTVKEATTMYQTIQNRIDHKDIKSDIYNPNEYNTLKYEKQNYTLTPDQQQILDEAWARKDTEPNQGKLGWDTSKTSIHSNKYYDWKADENKTGMHYYYDAKEKK